jgi:glycosyltransferase involved in cell wall biosynthesis
MRILWLSKHPARKDAYGQQTAITVPRLRDLGHDMAIAAYEGMDHAHTGWDGIGVYAAGMPGSAGMELIRYYHAKHDADVVIALCDAWAMSPRVMREMSTVAWTPVDAWPLSRALREFFTASGARPLAMSRWGQEMLGGAGFRAGYIPHSVPTGLFAPPEDRDALRAAQGIPAGTFTVVMNQANRSWARKALDVQIRAFLQFHTRHPDSRLLLHMAMDHPKGQDLPLLISRVGEAHPELAIGEGVVFFADQGAYAAGEIEMDQMPGLYGAADVTLQAVMAGGFELPALESQACGTPVIATATGPVAEVAGPHSWLVQGQDFFVEKIHEAFWTTPFIHEVDAALEAAWQAREDGSIGALRKQSREHALQYDADLVARDFWAPYLAELEGELCG